MGCLRFILALAVVQTHTSALMPFHLIPGAKAVQAFYIISGFYMALILEHKYPATLRGHSLFLSNRMLRIYPTYFVVLLVTLLFFAFVPLALGIANPLVDLKIVGENHGLLALAGMVFLNIFIVGQDILYFTAPAISEKVVLVGPAWTLSLELMFYMLAFYLARWKWMPLACLLCASIGIRVFLFLNGYQRDPWTFRFFPSELALFILGLLSFRLYRRIRPLKLSPVWFFACCAGLMWALFLFPVLDVPSPRAKTLLFFPLTALSLPVLFHFSKQNAFDRWIGDFSYPIYLSHFLVVNALIALNITRKSDLWMGWKTVAGSVLFSLVLLYLIIYPMDRLRAKRALAGGA